MEQSSVEEALGSGGAGQQAGEVRGRQRADGGDQGELHSTRRRAAQPHAHPQACRCDARSMFHMVGCGIDRGRLVPTAPGWATHGVVSWSRDWGWDEEVDARPTGRLRRVVHEETDGRCVKGNNRAVLYHTVAAGQCHAGLDGYGSCDGAQRLGSRRGLVVGPGVGGAEPGFQ